MLHYILKTIPYMLYVNGTIIKYKVYYCLVFFICIIDVDIYASARSESHIKKIKRVMIIEYSPIDTALDVSKAAIKKLYLKAYDNDGRLMVSIRYNYNYGLFDKEVFLYNDKRRTIKRYFISDKNKILRETHSLYNKNGKIMEYKIITNGKIKNERIYIYDKFANNIRTINRSGETIDSSTYDSKGRRTSSYSNESTIKSTYFYDNNSKDYSECVVSALPLVVELSAVHSFRCKGYTGYCVFDDKNRIIRNLILDSNSDAKLKIEYSYDETGKYQYVQEKGSTIKANGKPTTWESKYTRLYQIPRNADVNAYEPIEWYLNGEKIQTTIYESDRNGNVTEKIIFDLVKRKKTIIHAEYQYYN